MRAGLALLLGTLPALGWLYVFRRRDRYEPEPLREIAKFFALGALVTIPAGLLNGVAALFLHSDYRVAIAAAPLLEESSKFLLAALLLRGLAECDEPIDGAMYAVSIALGFAALENGAYIIKHGEAVMIARAFFSTLGHGLFAVPWGIALGLQTCGMGRPILTAAGLGVGIALHSVFNLLIGADAPIALAAFLLIAFPAFILLARELLKRSLRLSPFAGALRCTACREPVRPGARFCGACGSAAPTGWRCAHCEAQSPDGARFCGVCGHACRPAATVTSPVSFHPT